MIPVLEAKKRIISTTELMPTEQVPLQASFGRVLATDVSAQRTQPPYAVSAMDGYAVRAKDHSSTPYKLKIIGHAPAGQSFEGKVKKNEAVRIFTGAKIPEGADAVIIQENTKCDDKSVIVTNGESSVGQFIRQPGLDFKKGDILLKAGRVLTARDIGLAAGMNVSWLTVRRKPRIALLATGDEIAMPGQELGPNQIVSSNGPALNGFILALGGIPIDLGIAPDSRDGLLKMAEGAKGTDMLITCGGASVGEHDLVKSVLSEIGLKIEFWRIAMRPGKPLIYGKIGKTKMLGLPGNPVSALVCATIFLRPAINAMLGIRDGEPELEYANLTEVLLENDEREDYLRGILERKSDGSLHVTPLEKQDSSVFSGLAKADALIVREPFAPKANVGNPVIIIRLGGGNLSI